MYDGIRCWMLSVSTHTHIVSVLLRVYGTQQNKVALAPNVWGCYLMCELSLGVNRFSSNEMSLLDDVKYDY